MCGGENCEKDSFSGIRACMGIVSFLNWFVLRYLDSRLFALRVESKPKGCNHTRTLWTFGPIAVEGFDDVDDGDDHH